jgi:hypothetical protein
MELRSLVDVDLREVLAPINRAARGDFVPALRTVAQLRERVAAGLLDLGLSRAGVVGGNVAAACLVLRLAGENIAHIEALAADPLAQQRGAVRALIEAVQTAAGAAGVTEISALVSDLDSAQLSALQAAGFSRRQMVGRYTLSGAPAARSLPVELAPGEPAPSGQPWIRAVSLADVGAVLSDAASASPLYGARLPVLTRLSGRLLALASYPARTEDEAASAASAVVVCDCERKLLCALAGESEALASLICFAASRHGVAHVDALAESDAAVRALAAAGFARVAARVELVCDPRAAASPQRSTQAAGSAPASKGSE